MMVRPQRPIAKVGATIKEGSYFVGKADWLIQIVGGQAVPVAIREGKGRDGSDPRGASSRKTPRCFAQCCRAILHVRLRVKSYDELNALLPDRCVAHARAHRQPELRDQTVLSVFGAERPSLVPYVGRFDGFHAVMASVSKTSLVRFDNNRYRVSAQAVEERRIQMGTGVAKFPHQRTLEGFDFAAQPSVDPKQVRELATCRCLANGDALLIQGPPGVGKTHPAIVLGREAIRHGYSVLFTPGTLMMTLVRGHSEGKLEQGLAPRPIPPLPIPIPTSRPCP